VVVGGGATGVEYTGELSDFMLDALARLYPQLRPYVCVVLLQGQDELLPAFDAPLRQKALRSLEGRGVVVRLGTRVQRVHTPNRLTVCSTGADAAGGSDRPEDIDCGLIIWAAGTGPVPLTELVRSRLDDEQIPGGPDPTRRIRVDQWLRAVGAPIGTLLVLGDAALCAGLDGAPLPQTAQVAAQQGAFVARMLNRGYDLSSSHGAPVNREAAAGTDLGAWLRLRGANKARPFEFLNLGLLAYLGGGEAISQVQVGDQRLLSEAGSTGFLLWRSVYVVKQVSPRTRFLVLFDWIKTKVFGRDVTSW
jgi:NADH dehydrogenase FAD-containing subunit